jgi:hypothetical protein
MGRGFRRRTTRDCGNDCSDILGYHVARAIAKQLLDTIVARGCGGGRMPAYCRPVELFVADQHTRLSTT